MEVNLEWKENVKEPGKNLGLNRKVTARDL